MCKGPDLPEDLWMYPQIILPKRTSSLLTSARSIGFRVIWVCISASSNPVSWFQVTAGEGDGRLEIWTGIYICDVIHTRAVRRAQRRRMAVSSDRGV